MTLTKNKWEPWYAWHPVKVEGKWKWCTTVYRKYNWAKSTEQPFGKEYDYGTIFDMLRDNEEDEVMNVYVGPMP